MKDQNYQTVIKPERGLFEIPWKELWDYRDLLFLLVRRDIVAKYRRSFLGPLWFLIQPLLTAVVFTFVFKRGLNLSTHGIPGPLFYFCGLLPWGYFAQSFNAVSSSLVSNSGILNKVYFPRLILPLSVTISNLVPFVSQLAVFLVLYTGFHYGSPVAAPFHLKIELLFLLPVLLLQVMLAALGFGLWVAALTVKYRDLQNLTAFLIQIWMFLTPVIYPASAISGPWRQWLMLNPMAGVVETFRAAFFGIGDVSFEALLISTGISFLMFVSGILIFNQSEQTFADTL